MYVWKWNACMNEYFVWIIYFSLFCYDKSYQGTHFSLKSTFFRVLSFYIIFFFLSFSVFFCIFHFFTFPFLQFFGMFLKSNHSQFFCKERNSFRESSLLRIFFWRHFFKEVSSEKIEASQEDEDEIFRRIFFEWGKFFSVLNDV